MVDIVLAYDRQQDILELVTEYTNIILLQGEDVKQCLSSQHLDEEIKDLQKKYGLPYGRLYLATVDGKAAGCVALTRDDEEYCEIKRLYIRPEFRGHHLSKIMTEQIIGDAKSIGYKHMRLDTFPFMDTAIRLYEKYGFYYIDKYNDNPAKSAIFMQLDL